MDGDCDVLFVPVNMTTEPKYLGWQGCVIDIGGSALTAPANPGSRQLCSSSEDELQLRRLSSLIDQKGEYSSHSACNIAEASICQEQTLRNIKGP